MSIRRRPTMRSRTLPGGGACSLAVLVAAFLAAAASSSAQSVSCYTTPDHNAFVPISLATSTPLTLESTFTGLPPNQGGAVLDGGLLLYNGAGSFNEYDLAAATGSAILAEPGLSGAHAAVNSGDTVLWYASPAQRKVLIDSYDSSWKPLWSKDVTSPGPTFLGVPTLSGGSLFYASGTDAISVSVATGQVYWTAALPDLSFDTLTVSSGVVLASTQKGLVALNAGNGSQQWSQTLAQALPVSDFARLVVADGRYACQTSMKGSVTLLDLATGGVAWTSPASGPPLDSDVPPMLGSAGVLVPQVGALKLIDYSGRVVWSSPYAFVARKLSSPDYLTFDNVALAGGADGLYALSLTNGSVVWRSTKSAEVNGLQYADGRVYVGYRDGTLEVYKLRP